MAKIVSKRFFSENVAELVIEAPLIARSRRAGHFVMVRVDAHSERMPLTIADADTIKGTIKNAFLVSVVNIPYTIIFVLLMSIPFIMAVFLIEMAPFVLMVGFSLPAYVASIFWVRMFRKFEPQEVVESDGETQGEGSLEE